MKKINELKNILKQNTNLSEEFRKEILDSIIEAEELEEVKEILDRKVIDPIQKMLIQGRMLQRISILIALLSLFTAIFSTYNSFLRQPRLIDDARKDIIKQTRNVIPKSAEDRIFKNEEGKFGIISINGDLVLECNYDSIKFSRHHHGNEYYVVYRDGKQGLAHESGTLLLNPLYSSVSFVPPHFIWFRNNSKTGLYDIHKDLTIKPRFDNIYVVNEEYAIYSIDNEYGILKLSKDIIVSRNKFKKVRRILNNDTGYLGMIDKYYDYYELPEKKVKSTKITKFYSSNGRNGISNSIAEGEGKFGLINHKADFILPLEYDSIFWKNTILHTRKESHIEKWMFNKGILEKID